MSTSLFIPNTEIGAQRFLPCYNSGSKVIPPYGCCMLFKAGPESDYLRNGRDDVVIFEVGQWDDNRPKDYFGEFTYHVRMSHNIYRFAFNGHAPIEPKGTGAVTQHFPLIGRYKAETLDEYGHPIDADRAAGLFPQKNTFRIHEAAGVHTATGAIWHFRVGHNTAPQYSLQVWRRLPQLEGDGYDDSLIGFIGLYNALGTI